MSMDNRAQAKQATMEALQTINAVEGFDPASLAVEYTDLNSNEKRLRLPVMAQIGWFRLKNPEGRIAISVAPGKDCFVATARIYKHYTDPVDQFLAEATASRGYLAEKPTVSPREWAQTAAVGIALRNAGFGLQFAAAGDAFDTPAVDELGGIMWTGDPEGDSSEGFTTPQSTGAPESAQRAPQPTETPLEAAMKTPCPISKYNGKTLGEVLQLDPKALNWVATKFTGDASISAAAKLICEQALSQTA